MSGFSIRLAVAADRETICELLPRLAAFDIPARRQPEDLWRGDRAAILAWLEGDKPDAAAHVAIDASGKIAGIVFTQVQKELLSGEPSAHLEVLAVAEHAEGQGIATELVATAERAVRKRGAKSMTLSVFACNDRARALYEKLGYEGELIRYIKTLDT